MALLNSTETDYKALEVNHASGNRARWLRLGACAALCVSSFALGRLGAAPTAINGSDGEASESTDALATSAASGLWQPTILPIFRSEPLAKTLIRRFDLYLMNQATFDEGERKLKNVGQWLAPEFLYETVGFPRTTSLAEWCLGGEERLYRRSFPTTSFTQMLFFGDDDYVTTTSYGNAHWMKDLFGIPPSGDWTYFRVTDFYSVRKTGPKTGYVNYNFMMIDFADLFRRAGRPVLPPAPLPEGLVLPAAVNDGVPAPLSVVAAGQDSAAARIVATKALHNDWVADTTGDGLWRTDLTFYGPGGIGVARGTEEYEKHVLRPYRSAFANRSCDTKMFVCEGNYCGAYGVLYGNHVGTWVGLKESHKRVGLRFAMHWRVVDKRVQEGWAIFDFPGLFEQLGLDFFARARVAPIGAGARSFLTGSL
eukprot:TRINITY_DN21436_c0_g4_i1.p1 TRINITY_DN21436_c0_g4~~TRINITY_DN21436_c0_g4_i1.p1  ORF type:complete len:441 (+),score=49.88 TRINITY_DN21436_c0_g4_i1:57-1325(+)